MFMFVYDAWSLLLLLWLLCVVVVGRCLLMLVIDCWSRWCELAVVCGCCSRLLFVVVVRCPLLLFVGAGCWLLIVDVACRVLLLCCVCRCRVLFVVVGSRLLCV